MNSLPFNSGFKNVSLTTTTASYHDSCPTLSTWNCVARLPGTFIFRTTPLGSTTSSGREYNTSFNNWHRVIAILKRVVLVFSVSPSQSLILTAAKFKPPEELQSTVLPYHTVYFLTQSKGEENSSRYRGFKLGGHVKKHQHSCHNSRSNAYLHTVISLSS